MVRNFKVSACAIAFAAATITSGSSSNSAQAQTPSAAAAPVTLRSDAKIERIERDANGVEKTILHSPKDVAVVPGDLVLFTLFVNNVSAEPAIGFKATNPMPAAVRFDSVTEDWAEVSVDGGAN